MTIWTSISERVLFAFARAVSTRSICRDSVRAVAANLLGDTRRTGGCEDLCQAALKDTSENVRGAASKSLGEWMDANPEARRVLQQVASQDVSQDVRKIANQMLHSQDGFERSHAPNLLKLIAKIFEGQGILSYFSFQFFGLLLVKGSLSLLN